MKLVPSREALEVVDSGLFSLKQTSDGMRKSLKQDNTKDRIRENTKRNLSIRQFDAARKKDAERIVEAKTPRSFLRGGINGAIKGAKGFFAGILRAAGWVLLSVITEKLPEIVIIAERVVRIIERLKDTIVQTWNNVNSVLQEIKDVFAQFATNIANWDFLDKEGKLKKEFKDLASASEAMRRDLEFNFTDIGDELKNLFRIGKEDVEESRRKLGIEAEEEEKPKIPEIDLTIPDVKGKYDTLKKQLDLGEITQQQFDKEVEKLKRIPTAPPPRVQLPTYRSNTPLIQRRGAKPPGFRISDPARGYLPSRRKGHMGRDIPAEPGQGLTVPSKSTFLATGWQKGYGYWASFMDANGLEHFYAHMLEPSPYKRGDILHPGDIIGRVGSTGKSTGPHLHWELGKQENITGVDRPNPIDPLDFGFSPYAPFTGKRIQQKDLKRKLGPQASISAPGTNGTLSSEIAQVSPVVIPFLIDDLGLNKAEKTAATIETPAASYGSYAYEPNTIERLKKLDSKYT